MPFQAVLMSTFLPPVALAQPGADHVAVGGSGHSGITGARGVEGEYGIDPLHAHRNLSASPISPRAFGSHSPPSAPPSQPIIVSSLGAIAEMAAMLGLEELCETCVGALYKVGGGRRLRGGGLTSPSRVTRHPEPNDLPLQ